MGAVTTFRADRRALRNRRRRPADSPPVDPNQTNRARPIGVLTDALSIRDRRRIAVTLIITVIVNLTGVAATIYSGRVINALLANSPDAVRLAGVTAALAVTSAVGRLAAEWITLAVGRDMGVRLQTTLVRHAFSWPTRELTERSAGELTDRSASDVDVIVSAFASQFLPTVAGIIGLITAGIGALFIDWRLAVFFVVLLLSIVLTGRRGLTRMAKGGQALQAAWADGAGIAEEAMAARVDLRQLLGRPFFARRWEERAKVVWSARRTYTSAVLRLRAVTFTILAAGEILVLIVGAIAATRGSIEAGTVWSAVALTGVAGTQIKILFWASRELALLVGALARVSDVLSLPSESADPAGLQTMSQRLPQHGTIEIRDLTVGYDDGIVLSDVTMRVEDGEHVAVIGRTGAGKSTLARAIVRHVDIPQGSIFLDGIDICDLDVRWLRRNVIAMPQRQDIIEDTVFANVTLYDPDITRSQVDGALAELGLGEWIDSLGGLDARLGLHGAQLSAGEVQLIAFARLLVRTPLVVVMDEATASLDPLTERRVQEAATRVMRGRTALIIAHRLSTVDEADSVAVFEHGRLVERGARAALAADAESRYAIARRIHTSEPAAATGVAEPAWFEAVDAGAVSAADAAEADARSGDPITQFGAGGAGIGVTSLTDGEPGGAEVAAEVVDDARPTPPTPERFAMRQYAKWRRFGILGAASWYVSLSAALVAAWLWGSTIDVLRPGGDVRPYVIGFVMLAAAEMAGAAGGDLLFTRWWNLVNLRMRGNVFRSQLASDAPSGARPAASPGEVVGRSYDTNESISYTDNFVDSIVWAVIIGIFIASGLEAPLWVLLVPFTVVLALALALRRRTAAISIELARVRTQWVSLTANLFAAAATVKSYAAEPNVVRRLNEEASHRGRLTFRRDRLSVWISSAMRISLTIVVYWVLWRAAGGVGLSRGERALLAGGALALIQVAQSMPEFARTLISMVNRRASITIRLRRADALLHAGDDLLGEYPESERVSTGTFRHVEPPERPSPVVASTGSRALEIVEVVGLPVEPTPGLVVAEPVDFVARRGEFVVVTGPVGSGKSFVLEALVGLNAAAAPYLRWNGETVDDPLTWMRPPLVAYVPQAPALVSASLDGNVSLDYDRDVAAALDLAQFDVDTEVSEGLATVIGHRGLRLSGGQAQRVAAARAFAVKAELTVVDDLSSALDGATEARLWHALRADGRTVVASSHSPVALALADRVVELVPA